MGYSVLIVDDERMPREILCNHIDWPALSIDQVHEACDGAQGLEVARRVRPHIIISDIKMPRLSGIQLAAQVRAFLPECRFVFLSGYADKDNLKEAIKLKASSFLEKPIDLDEVTSLMRALVKECACLPPNAAKVFFRGSDRGEALNTAVFTLPRETLRTLDSCLKAGQQHEAALLIQRTAADMGRCEGSDIEYLRNVFCQMMFVLSHAAEARNIAGFAEQTERCLHTVTHAATLQEAQQAVLDSLGQFFAASFRVRQEPLQLLMQYLEQHFSQPDITIKSIAQSLNFTPTYLCMLCKKGTGKTINSHLTDLRVEKACQLLKTTDMKLYKVGQAVGYNDGKYFFRVFRKATGMTPREYRERGM